MKLFILMLLMSSSFCFAAEVGENMKAQCTQIVSAERVDQDTSTDVDSEDNSDSNANGQ
tara:strand:- start:96 stop:272 length:177 start_codon:yes stop_codon:yes gene_type:complete